MHDSATGVEGAVSPLYQPLSPENSNNPNNPNSHSNPNSPDSNSKSGSNKKKTTEDSSHWTEYDEQVSLTNSFSQTLILTHSQVHSLFLSFLSFLSFISFFPFLSPERSLAQQG